MKNRVDSALRSAGLTLSTLSAQAEQVILFGSCAVGCESANSDVDLLCVGTGKRLDTGCLHLLWIEAATLSAPRWLGSELGGHVSRFGVWLAGERTLGPPQPPSAHTLRKKRQRILDRASTLASKWPLLSEHFKRAQLRQLRLDLQRHRLLLSGEPVPPSPLLDAAWKRERGTMETLPQMISGDLPVEDALRQLIPLALDLSADGTGAVSRLRGDLSRAEVARSIHPSSRQRAHQRRRAKSSGRLA